MTERSRDAAPAVDGWTTRCGSLTCATATEICVAIEHMGGPAFSCFKAPAACLDDRSCQCLGSVACNKAPHLTYKDYPSTPNLETCACPNCRR